jgi:vitamin K-dependent gamma-carboxylase-like protein
MKPSNAAESRPAGGWFTQARELYATADARVLGAFRIFFALVLLAELGRRAQNLTLFYSNDGVLTNHFVLFSPQADPQWSLLFSCSTPGQATVAFALIALVDLALLVGWFTRAAQLLALAGIVSLNARNLAFEDGGVVVLIVLATFTAFLPLGDRFSIDAIRRRVRAEQPAPRPAPFRTAASIAVLALTVEAVCIYAFNVLQKTGPTWRHGEAVHWVLWQNRVITSFGAWLRLHEPAFFSPLCTYATYLIESAIALLVLSPVRPARCRAIALALGAALHGSMALFLKLGPFPLSMVSLLLVLQRPETFDAVSGWLARRLRLGGGPPRALAYDASLPGPRRAVAFLTSLDAFGALEPRADLAAEAGMGPGLALRSGGEGEGFRADPDGALALAELPAVRRLAPALLPLTRSWLAMAPEPSPPPDPRPEFASVGHALSAAREALAGALLLAVLMQMSIDNFSVPNALRVAPPKPFAALVLYPRLLQGWRMFAPDAPKEDGIGVVDATTAGGRHIDPFTGAEPALEHALDGPVPHNVMVSDYLFAMQMEQNQRYHRDLRAYIEDWHQRTGRPRGDRITQYKVYWVSQDSPPPGQTKPTNYKRRLLFEGGGPGGGRR